jgi:hypothetical protein
MGGDAASPRAATGDTTGGDGPYIEEHPNEHPIGTAHLTKRVCDTEAEQFERLWREYPRRPDDPKQTARQAFNELINGGTDSEILIGAAIRYTAWVGRDAPGHGRYVPYLHRWLREGRYQQDAESRPGVREDRVYWLDRLGELERKGVWLADWGPAPNEPACQLPPQFRNKPCVRRWLQSNP